MKHTFTITLFLVLIFVLAQLTGLFLINKDISDIKTTIIETPQGNKTVYVPEHNETAVGPRPDVSGFGSFIYLVIGVAIGTILILVLVKYNKINLWRFWFFIAVWIAISISLGVLIKTKIFFSYDVAMAIAFLLALWKILKPNIIIHNVTEILMYAGIAVLLVPIFDILWIFILLIVISGYDMFAVWKSKHMVSMAQFQTKSNVFAGLMIPYKRDDKKLKINLSSKTSAKKIPKIKKEKYHNAILGGGDIAFPLLFSGVVMQNLIYIGLTKTQAFLQTSIITLTTTIALAILFFAAKKDKFYPAMPFLTIGCLVGYGIVLLINII